MDAELYANNVRRVMCNAMNVPATEHSHSDVLLHSHAQMKKELKNSNITQLEYKKVHEVFFFILDVCFYN